MECIPVHFLTVQRNLFLHACKASINVFNFALIFVFVKQHVFAPSIYTIKNILIYDVREDYREEDEKPGKPQPQMFSGMSSCHKLMASSRIFRKSTWLAHISLNKAFELDWQSPTGDFPLLRSVATLQIRSAHSIHSEDTIFARCSISRCIKTCSGMLWDIRRSLCLQKSHKEKTLNYIVDGLAMACATMMVYFHNFFDNLNHISGK